MRSMSLSTLILSVFLLLPSAFSYIFEEVSVQASDPLPYPTIGLFTQPSPFSSAGYPSTEFSYFAGSYVKHLEAAGATVIPIQWDLPYDELDVLLSKINGILFPGGGTTLVNSTTETPSIFTQAGMHIIEKAIEFNKNGDYFPVWATCLGYELLVLSMSGNMTLLIDISDGDDVAKTLNVTQEGLNGLYAEMPADLLNATETANVSYFHHKHTPDPNAFTNDTNLATNFTVAAWTASSIGQYAASIQGTTFPFMGSQFHPEKNTFEWFSTTQVPHSLDAIRTEQYYTYYFINMTLKNKHSFSSIDDLQKSWLYNYQPKHFGPNPEFEEVYVFENYQTYDKSVKLISEYPEGFGPSSDDSDSTDKDISEDEVFRFKEGTPFLFTEEAMAKWH